MDKKISSLIVWEGWKRFLWIIGCLVVFLIACFLIILVGIDVKSEVDLPKMSIVLNGVSLDTINGNDKNIIYGGNELFWNDGERELSFSDVEIKGRGNYTWMDDKKPYQIRFQKKIDLIGMGESRKWNLMTNNLDDSLLRNDLAQYLAEIVGEEYVMKGEFIDLKIDGEDLGVFYLTKKVSIGKGVVDLKDEHGVLVELDNNYCEYEENKVIAKGGDCLVFKDFVNEDLSEESMEIFMEKYNDFEEIALNGDYELLSTVIDLESLAMYFLVSEFSGNSDAYLSSFYFYLDGEDDLIHAGPMWDFDSAFGNLNWGDGELEDYAYDPWSLEHRLRQLQGLEFYDEDGNVKKIKPDGKVANTVVALVEMPEFIGLVRRIYDDRLRPKKAEVVRYIGEMAQSIRKSALKDAEIWGKNDFDEAVSYLKWWVEQRFWFFDAKFSRGMMRKFEGVEI